MVMFNSYGGAYQMVTHPLNPIQPQFSLDGTIHYRWSSRIAINGGTSPRLITAFPSPRQYRRALRPCWASVGAAQWRIGAWLDDSIYTLW